NAGPVARVAIDEVDQRVADALDRGYVELHRSRVGFDTPRALLDSALVGERRVPHAKGDGADRRPVHACERLREALRPRVDDEVDPALAVEGYILGAVPGDCRKPELLEHLPESDRIGRRIFDELEAVGAERIVPKRGLRAAHGLS